VLAESNKATQTFLSAYTRKPRYSAGLSLLT